MSYKFNPFTGTLDEVSEGSEPNIKLWDELVYPSFSDFPNLTTLLFNPEGSSLYAPSDDGVTESVSRFYNKTQSDSVYNKIVSVKSDNTLVKANPVTLNFDDKFTVTDDGSDGVDVVLNSTAPVEKFITVNASGNTSEATSNIGMYTRQISTSTGTVTVYVTSNSAASGDAVFNQLSNCSITAIMRRDTADNSESPWVHIRSISNGQDSITLQVKRSNDDRILLGGAYYGNLDNDGSATIHLTVTGELA